MLKPPAIIDLFSGCGGMTRGFVDAGCEPVLAVEHNLFAASTYAANFGERHVFHGDIETLPDSRVAEVGEVDLVIGGPPCQGFSQLGPGDLDDPRNKLWREFVRVVSIAKPKLFVIENVPRFLASPDFAILEREVTSGALRDYRIARSVLNAADFGIAQKRKRAIVVGCRRDIGEPSLPNPTHTDGRDTALSDHLPPWITLESALKRVEHQVAGTELPLRTQCYFNEDVPGHFRGADLHFGRNPQKKSLDRYRLIGPGQNRKKLPDHLLAPCWRNHQNGSGDVMGRLEWEKPAVSIRCEFFKPEKGRFLHPQFDIDEPSNCVNRPLTHLEALLIQGFTRSYKWCGTKLEIARQIGNAVPPLFARRIAEETLRVIG